MSFPLLHELWLNTIDVRLPRVRGAQSPDRMEAGVESE